jgi:putative transcriptional regulator
MIKKGNLIIAKPNVFNDKNFRRSVILIAEHNHSGSVGFIINKKIEYSTKEIIPELKTEFPIYNGGPVQKDNLYFIHIKSKLIPGCLKIKNEIYWGGDFKKVLHLINEKKIKSDEIKFFSGYSGWIKNQLENEINSDSWIVSNKKINEKLLFKNSENIWKLKLLELGGEYLLWSNSPENPNHN